MHSAQLLSRIEQVVSSIAQSCFLLVVFVYTVGTALGGYVGHVLALHKPSVDQYMADISATVGEVSVECLLCIIKYWLIQWLICVSVKWRSSYGQHIDRCSLN